MNLKKLSMIIITMIALTSCESGIEDMYNDANLANAALRSLEVSQGSISPEFQRGITDYTIYADDGVDSIFITAAAENRDAELKFRIAGGTWTEGAIQVDNLLTTPGRTIALDLQVTSGDGDAVVEYRFSVRGETVTFTINFDSQGAGTEASPSVKTVTTPEFYIDSLPVPPAKDLYTFRGWYTSTNGAGTEFTAASPVTADMTLYAYWVPEIKVTYDSDGGSAVSPQYIINAGDTVGTLPPDPQKPGSAFDGWYSLKNGGGTAFTSATPVTADITVYAKWIITEIPFYRVTYSAPDKTGGTVPVDSSTYDYYDSATVQSSWSDATGNLYKIENGTAYRCSGWSNGTGNVYAENDTFYITSDVTLTAVWTEYALGDRGPAGGWIFHIASSYSGNPSWRYMEAAPNDFSITYIWSFNGSSLPSATSEAVGAGRSNTQKILEQNDHGNCAAFVCSEYSFAGYDKIWFLPSLNELALMYQNLYEADPRIGGFTVGGLYWSSTEYNDNAACRKEFSGSPAELPATKGASLLVRAARAF